MPETASNFKHFSSDFIIILVPSALADSDHLYVYHADSEKYCLETPSLTPWSPRAAREQVPTSDNNENILDHLAI